MAPLSLPSLCPHETLTDATLCSLPNMDLFHELLLYAYMYMHTHIHFNPEWLSLTFSVHSVLQSAPNI